MKIVCKQSVLLDLVMKASKGLTGKINTPILNGLYMEVTHEQLSVVGSNLDSTIRAAVPIDENITVEEPGKIIFPKSIVDIVRKLSGDISISSDDSFIAKVEANKSHFELTGMDAEEYPKVFKNEEKNPLVLTLNGKLFQEIVTKTIMCCATVETRPILQAIYFRQNSKNSLSLTATDSHRLANVVLNDLPDINAEGLTCPVPGSSLANMAKIFDEAEEVQFFISESQIMVKNHTLTYCTRVLEGNYPDTNRLVPTDFKTEFKARRKELMSALEQISILSKDGIANLQSDGLMLSLTSQNSEIGRGKTDVAYLDFTGDEINISFSIRFAIDALKAYECDDIYMKLNGNAKPFVIQSDNPLETQLILPIRTV